MWKNLAIYGRTPIGLDKAVRNLNKNQIDGLVIIGGNGSFNGAVNKCLNASIHSLAIATTTQYCNSFH